MAGRDSIAELLGFLKNDKAPLMRKGGANGGAHSEIYIARAPGRLDVMGGIADYTGSLVCELPLDVAAAVAVQRRDDRELIIKRYVGTGAAGGGDEIVSLSLDDFYGTAALMPIQTLQDMFAGGKQWAAHVAGAYPTLAKHKKITRRTHGANIACYSNVPHGGGVAASAAMGCAALFALVAAYHLILEPLEIALLAHKLENQIVGVPSGIMDQMTAVFGKKDRLLLIRCQPHELVGTITVPRGGGGDGGGFLFAGIHSNVQHSANGDAYRKARVSAFMAQAIIARFYKDMGNKTDPSGGYLARVPVELYRRYFRAFLPETLIGAAFLKEYEHTADRATQVNAGETYHPRAAAEHHVLENGRVEEFVGHMKVIAAGKTPVEERRARAAAAGKLMLESHASYSQHAGLGAEETDLLVELVTRRGPARGFYGARITGGGSGGTVAVLMMDSAETRAELQAIGEEYRQRTGNVPRLFLDSSDGASETEAVRVGAGDLNGDGSAER